MSYAVKRAETGHPGTASADPPTSALVRDFICLYSHDLRRKQKRWQDGKLKYHTFNKRIMVYDDRGGFVGDAYWSEDYEFGEGEEFSLERGSAVVQVCDCTGSREQDLTAILDKRAREVEKRRETAAVRTPARREQDGRSHLQPRNLPLNAVVANPGAPIGRAVVPDKSPYEARMTSVEGSAPKRRKLSASPPSKSGWASSLFGTKISLTGGITERRRLSKRAGSSVAKTSEEEKMNDEDDVVVVEDRPRLHNMGMDRRATAQRPGNTDTNIRTQGRKNDFTNGNSMMGQVRKASKSSADEDNEMAGPLPDKGPAQSRVTVPTRVPPPKTKEPMRPSSPLFIEDNDFPEQAGDGGRSPPPEPSKPEPAPKAKQTTQAKATALTKKPAPATTKPKSAVKQATTLRDDAQVSPEIIEVTPEPEIPKRAELRIKSRRKRGLLMVSEKKTQEAKNTESQFTEKDVDKDIPDVLATPEPPTMLIPSSIPEPLTQDSGPTSHREPLRLQESDHEPEEPPGVVANSGEGASDKVAPNDQESDESDESDVPVTRQVRQRRKKKVRELSDSSDETPPQEARRRRANGAHEQDFPFSSDSSDGQEMIPEAKPERRPRKKQAATKNTMGPRVVRIRKGVKCKEIIGLLPDDDLIPAPFMAADSCVRAEEAPGFAAASALRNELTDAPPESDAKPPPRAPTADTKRGPAPRIANPATRGRKAARKEDAAGAVPQVMVPLEPVMARRTVGAPPTLERKTSSTTPAFTTANGGAWSRHAEDLLGMTRPAGKR